MSQIKQKINQEEFNKAIIRYLLRGWIISKSDINFSDANHRNTMMFVLNDEDGRCYKKLRLDSSLGVSVASEGNNFVFTNWNDLNCLTLCL